MYSIELNVTISAVYTPAPGEDPEKWCPNEFTAGSALTLNCTVTQWRSDICLVYNRELQHPRL